MSAFYGLDYSGPRLFRTQFRRGRVDAEVPNLPGPTVVPLEADIAFNDGAAVRVVWDGGSRKGISTLGHLIFLGDPSWLKHESMAPLPIGLFFRPQV